MVILMRTPMKLSLFYTVACQEEAMDLDEEHSLFTTFATPQILPPVYHFIAGNLHFVFLKKVKKLRNNEASEICISDFSRELFFFYVGPNISKMSC